MSSYLTTEDILNELQVSESTLKNWEKQFNLKTDRGPRNQKRYDDYIVDVLKTIKKMRDDERGFDTIRQVVNQKQTQENSLIVSPSESGITLVPGSQDLVTEVIKAIQEQTGLSEKYARATYTIGQLEAEKKAVESQSRTIQETMQKDLNKLQEELNEKQEKLIKFRKSWIFRLFFWD